jgi:hypothetical protein
MSRIVAVLFALALTCATPAAEQLSASQALVAGLAKWSRVSTKTYSFRLHFTGHVPGIGRLPPAQIQVRNGQVVASKLLGPLDILQPGSKSPQDPYLARYFWTSIDDLFGKAADSIEYVQAHPTASLRIDYDAEHGFPRIIGVSDPEVSDADGEYLVSDFKGGT